MNTISPKHLSETVSDGKKVDLIDVRTPVEFREIHIPFANNIPLDRLDPAGIAKERANNSNPLFVVCHSGSRAKQACEKLAAAGCPNVILVEGGTMAWNQAGLQVIRGKKAISLERQIRIVAGSLVFSGVMLGTFVHPYFYGLSGFVGMGLIFAGVTDICPMGMMIGRMPWNQVRDGAACATPATTSK
jgi:rhodanese-related sulfurtransferase